MAVGLKYSPGCNLNIRLAGIFDEDKAAGPQIGWNLLEETCNPQGLVERPLTSKLLDEIDDLARKGLATVNWDIEMKTDEQEWQRIRLGGILSCIAIDPSFRIRLGQLHGDDVPVKSYPKVIKEFEKRGFKPNS